jgi:WD40 repeat protein
MVRIATITHAPLASTTRSTNAEHPFSRAREFQRAHNATKLQKLFAKPLLAALQGHSDGISVLSKCPRMLSRMISGAYDGEIRVWDLSQRSTLISLYDHKDAIKGVSFSPDGLRFLSSAADKSIHLYDFKSMFEGDQQHLLGDFRLGKNKRALEPLNKYLSKSILGKIVVMQVTLTTLLLSKSSRLRGRLFRYGPISERVRFTSWSGMWTASLRLSTTLRTRTSFALLASTVRSSSTTSVARLLCRRLLYQTRQCALPSTLWSPSISRSATTMRTATPSTSDAWTALRRSIRVM